MKLAFLNPPQQLLNGRHLVATRLVVTREIEIHGAEFASRHHLIIPTGFQAYYVTMVGFRGSQIA
jgi:hypothetical protein